MIRRLSSFLFDRCAFQTVLIFVPFLLAGGGKANATPGGVTVRCVPNVNVNAGCTSPNAYSTIQAAVNAAVPGDVIFVGPGTYNEAVTISTSSISLLGAQAGNDARIGRKNRLKESIVNGKTNSGQNIAIWISASGVVVDGFTVSGVTSAPSPYPAAGILIGTQNSFSGGEQIINNVLENNGVGLYVYEGAAPSAASAQPSVVAEHNLIRNNNAGTVGSVGFGISLNGATYPNIAENAFMDNRLIAISVVGGGFASVMNNTSENDGAFAFFAKTSQALFSHNTGKNFGYQGVLPGPNSTFADAAIEIGPANKNLVISDNVLEKGQAPISNGIAFSTVFDAGLNNSTPNATVNVEGNKVMRFPGDGIMAEASTGGTLTFSWVQGNQLLENGASGIVIDANNYNISLFDNQAGGNSVSDCSDESVGGGTLGTANGWFNNTGSSSFPNGLCSPARRPE